MIVERHDLEELLEMLKKAQEFRDYGDTKAYALERQARQKLESLLGEGADAKSTT